MVKSINDLVYINSRTRHDVDKEKTIECGKNHPDSRKFQVELGALWTTGILMKPEQMKTKGDILKSTRYYKEVYCHCETVIK